MEYGQELFIGIDPGAIAGRAKRAFTYAALDTNRNLVALANGDLNDVLAYISSLSQATVAVNGPARLNSGLLSRQPNLIGGLPQRSARMRQVESEFRARGLHIPTTPSTIESCPRWMKACLQLFHQLAQAGFAEFPAAGNPRQVMETQSEALFSAWTNSPQLLPAGSLEGRIQRQLALLEQRMPVWDAMDLFEEVTRHKFLRGILPVERLHSHLELNALAAAALAWQAGKQPELLHPHGEPSEGVIFA